MACKGGANSRNGYRERGLVTPAGKITLRIPKLRCGTYFPEGMPKRYSRADKAAMAERLVLVAMESAGMAGKAA